MMAQQQAQQAQMAAAAQFQAQAQAAAQMQAAQMQAVQAAHAQVQAQVQSTPGKQHFHKDIFLQFKLKKFFFVFYLRSFF
jgi:hypothetical protein